MKSLGTAACPPYHIAIVVGGTSAEACLKTVKLALTGRLVVARDIAHAKLRERLDAGSGQRWSKSEQRSPHGVPPLFQRTLRGNHTRDPMGCGSGSR